MNCVLLFLLSFYLIKFAIAQDGILYTRIEDGTYTPILIDCHSGRVTEGYKGGIFLYHREKFINVHKAPDYKWLNEPCYDYDYIRDDFVPEEYHLYTCSRDGMLIRMDDFDKKYPGGIYLRILGGFMKVHKHADKNYDFRASCKSHLEDPLGSKFYDNRGEL